MAITPWVSYFNVLSVLCQNCQKVLQPQTVRMTFFTDVIYVNHSTLVKVVD